MLRFLSNVKYKSSSSYVRKFWFSILYNSFNALENYIAIELNRIDSTFSLIQNKQLTFNYGINNLINHIARKQGISYERGEKLIIKFILY